MPVKPSYVDLNASNEAVKVIGNLPSFWLKKDIASKKQSNLLQNSFN